MFLKLALKIKKKHTQGKTAYNIAIWPHERRYNTQIPRGLGYVFQAKLIYFH